MSRNPVATVKGGLYESAGLTTLTQQNSQGALRRKIAQHLDGKGLLDLRARMTALDGVAAGANAAKTLTRVQAAEDLSGTRVIETETLINRITTAADVTEIEGTINNFTSKTTFGASPPANLDGNPLGTR